MDPDLEERQRFVDEEYSAEALRAAQSNGPVMTPRLRQLLEEQEDIVREFLRRDRNRLALSLVGVVVFITVALFLASLIWR